MTDRIFRFAKELETVVPDDKDWESSPLEFKVANWDSRGSIEKASITASMTALNFAFDRDV